MKIQAIALPINKILTKQTLFYLTIFTLPLLSHANQLLVGTAVNLMLFLGAKNLTHKELILLAILPSLGAISNGVLFGSFTMLLIYFAPAIWLGNYLMMRVFNQTKNLPTLISIISAALVKTALLFGVALSLVKLSLVPTIFLTAMGTVQFITATTGGILANLLSQSKLFTETKEPAND
ncbi:MAG: hypothetical protein ACOZAK_03075 [Patescibacteria group bacterium]